jgi:hypothetical protein
VTRNGHDPRCERSRTKVSRCRCRDCGGGLHGAKFNQDAMLRALAREAITEDEYTDWLNRMRRLSAGALR